MPLSFGQIKASLPVALFEKFESQFGQSRTEMILRGFGEERNPTMRINTLMTNMVEIMNFLRANAVQFERPKFPENSLLVKNKNEKFLEKLIVYEEGKIYFQNLSSQLPVVFLDPKPGEKVLDMCAAPGSKTTQIAALMGNEGSIVANDIDRIRVERLKYNLQKQGATIAEVIKRNGANLREEYPEKFDRVLLDAPCSAEGRMSVSEPRSYKFWSQKVVNENAKLQRRLITSAIKALKPGGTLVYSTCSLMDEENGQVVKFAMENSDGKMVLEKIKIPISNVVEGQYGVTVLPERLWEGFFVSKLRRV